MGCHAGLAVPDAYVTGQRRCVRDPPRRLGADPVGRRRVGLRRQHRLRHRRHLVGRLLRAADGSLLQAARRLADGRPGARLRQAGLLREPRRRRRLRHQDPPAGRLLRPAVLADQHHGDRAPPATPTAPALPGTLATDAGDRAPGAPRDRDPDVQPESDRPRHLLEGHRPERPRGPAGHPLPADPAADHAVGRHDRADRPRRARHLAVVARRGEREPRPRHADGRPRARRRRRSGRTRRRGPAASPPSRHRSRRTGAPRASCSCPAASSARRAMAPASSASSTASAPRCSTRPMPRRTSRRRRSTAPRASRRAAPSRSRSRRATPKARSSASSSAITTSTATWKFTDLVQQGTTTTWTGTATASHAFGSIGRRRILRPGRRRHGQRRHGVGQGHGLHGTRRGHDATHHQRLGVPAAERSGMGRRSVRDGHVHLRRQRRRSGRRRMSRSP